MAGGGRELIYEAYRWTLCDGALVLYDVGTFNPSAVIAAGEWISARRLPLDEVEKLAATKRPGSAQ